MELIEFRFLLNLKALTKVNLLVGYIYFGSFITILLLATGSILPIRNRLGNLAQLTKLKIVFSSDVIL